MRLVDVGDSVPGMFLAFVVIAVLGRGMTTAMIAVGLIFVSSYIRLTRACVLIEREKTYVDSARVMGMRSANIMFRQILPNVASPLVVRTTVYAGRAILIEAALSFLGMGLDVNRASWGGMLQAATAYGFTEPALVLAPGLAITLTVLALNLFGDSLRDSLAVGSAGRPPAAARRCPEVECDPHHELGQHPSGRTERGTPHPPRQGVPAGGSRPDSGYRW
jgi:peptide/nickel transport system permease protein